MWHVRLRLLISLSTNFIIPNSCTGIPLINPRYALHYRRQSFRETR